MNNQDSLNEYMEYYRNIPIQDKRNILLEELKMLAAGTNLACKSLEVNNDILINKDLVDVKEQYNEDDYLEALMVYVCSTKNSFSDLIEGLNKITDDIEG